MPSNQWLLYAHVHHRSIYNKLNNRTGFKISKLTFQYQLEIELVKELIIHCNGDPKLVNQFIHLILADNNDL